MSDHLRWILEGPTHRGSFVDWSHPRVIAMLMLLEPQRVAERLGCAPRRVYEVRSSRGITRDQVEWTPENLAILREHGPAETSRRLGCSPQAAGNAAKWHGITGDWSRSGDGRGYKPTNYRKTRPADMTAPAMWSRRR